MEKRLNNIDEKYGHLSNTERHPAIILYMSSQGFTWDDISNNKDDLIDVSNSRDYLTFRNKTLKHVIDLLDVEFSHLIPGRFAELYSKLTKTDLVILLEVLENAWDIAHGEEIGTIRRLGWDYLKYDESFGISEREWITNNINEIKDRGENDLLYFDILMYVYWQKRLKVVRM